MREQHRLKMIEMDKELQLKGFNSATDQTIRKEATTESAAIKQMGEQERSISQKEHDAAEAEMQRQHEKELAEKQAKEKPKK